MKEEKTFSSKIVPVERNRKDGKMLTAGFSHR